MYPLFKGYILEYTQDTLTGYRIHFRIHRRYIAGYIYGIRIGCTKKAFLPYMYWKNTWDTEYMEYISRYNTRIHEGYFGYMGYNFDNKASVF